jgi:hypothetical protein
MNARQPDYRAFLTAEDYLLQEEVQAFRLPRTADLVGQSLTLYPDDHNAPGGIEFKDHTTLIWRAAHQTPHTGLYDAIQLRPDIYFIDWVVPDAPNETMSVVLDFLTQEATIVHCRLPKSPEEASFDFAHRISQYNDLSTAKANVRYAGIGQPRQTYHHRQSQELIGRRLIHLVSDQHQYEHIYLNQHMMGSSTLKRGGGSLVTKTGVQTYSSWHAATQSQEESHEPHDRILPQSGVSGQRPNWPGQHRHPFAQGQAVYVYRVPQNVQCHARHGILPSAHCGRNRDLGGDVAGPRLSAPSHRRGVWL